MSKRDYTAEELVMINDPFYTAKEIANVIGVHPITISRLRVLLGVKTISGARKGKSVPTRIKREIRYCIGKDCSATFEVVPSSKKKFCCHSCQQRTANVAAKGIGSRKIRNPLSAEYKRYARTVHGLSNKTYKENIDLINPNRYNRTLCGVENGWQLDHIIPIKECFLRGMTAIEASSVDNLRMLPWKQNLMRQYDIQNKDTDC